MIGYTQFACTDCILKFFVYNKLNEKQVEWMLFCWISDVYCWKNLEEKSEEN